MNLKQYHRYRMDFGSKAARLSTLFIGGSLFLLAVHYFLLRELSSVKAAEAIFKLTLPILLSVAFIVLGRILKLNAPGLFAIVGAAFCLVLMISAFSSGSLLRGVLGGIWYILCAVVLLGTAGGFLPGTQPATVMFAVALIIRLVFDLRLRGISNWVYELSGLLLIAALMCLPRSFQPIKHRK